MTCEIKRNGSSMDKYDFDDSHRFCNFSCAIINYHCHFGIDKESSTEFPNITFDGWTLNTRRRNLTNTNLTVLRRLRCFLWTSCHHSALDRYLLQLIIISFLDLAKNLQSNSIMKDS